MAKMLCSGYMRVHISRGQGGRGYGGASHLTPYVFVSTGEWSEQAQPKTFELEVVNWRLGHLPALAGLKHNNRLEQVMIAQELEEKRMADGLVLDIEDNLIETSKANLFWFDGQNWMTPDLSRCGNEGIIRAHILRQNPKIVVTNSKYSRVLDTCQSMLLCNSLLGCKAVTKLAGKSLNTQAIDTLNLTGT